MWFIKKKTQQQETVKILSWKKKFAHVSRPRKSNTPLRTTFCILNSQQKERIKHPPPPRLKSRAVEQTSQQFSKPSNHFLGQSLWTVHDSPDSQVMSPERSSRRHRKKWRQEMSERQYSLSRWRLGRWGEKGFHDQCVALRRITVHCWSQLFHFCWRHLCKVKSGCHHGHNYWLCQRLETESVYVKPSEELDDLFTLYRM